MTSRSSASAHTVSNESISATEVESEDDALTAEGEDDVEEDQAGDQKGYDDEERISGHEEGRISDDKGEGSILDDEDDYARATEDTAFSKGERNGAVDAVALTSDSNSTAYGGSHGNSSRAAQRNGSTHGAPQSTSKSRNAKRKYAIDKEKCGSDVEAEYDARDHDARQIRGGSKRERGTASGEKRALRRKRGYKRLFMTVNVPTERARAAASHARLQRSRSPERSAYASPNSRGPKAIVQRASYWHGDDVGDKRRPFRRHRISSNGDGNNGAAVQRDDSDIHPRRDPAWLIECIRCLRSQQHCTCPPVLQQLRRRVSYSARCATCHAESLGHCRCPRTAVNAQKQAHMCRRCNQSVACCSCPPVLSWFRSIREDGKVAGSASPFGGGRTTDARTRAMDGTVEKFLDLGHVRERMLRKSIESAEQEARLQDLNGRTRTLESKRGLHLLETKQAERLEGHSRFRDLLGRTRTLESKRNSVLREDEQLEDYSPIREFLCRTRTLESKRDSVLQETEQAEHHSRFSDSDDDQIHALESPRSVVLQEGKQLHESVPGSAWLSQEVRLSNSDDHLGQPASQVGVPHELAPPSPRTVDGGRLHDDVGARDMLQYVQTLSAGDASQVGLEHELAALSPRAMDGERLQDDVVARTMLQYLQTLSAGDASQVGLEHELAALSPRAMDGERLQDDVVARTMLQYLQTLSADGALDSPRARLHASMRDMDTVFEDTFVARDRETHPAPALLHDLAPRASLSKAQYDSRVDRIALDAISLDSARERINERHAREIEKQAAFAADQRRIKELRRHAMDVERRLYALRQRTLQAPGEAKEHTMHHGDARTASKVGGDTIGHSGKKDGLRILRELHKPKDIGTPSMKVATHTAAKAGFVSGPRLIEQDATGLFGADYPTSPRHVNVRRTTNDNSDAGRTRRKQRWVNDVYHPHNCYVRDQYPELFAPRPRDEGWRRPQKYMTTVVRVGGGFRAYSQARKVQRDEQLKRLASSSRNAGAVSLSPDQVSLLSALALSIQKIAALDTPGTPQDLRGISKQDMVKDGTASSSPTTSVSGHQSSRSLM